MGNMAKTVKVKLIELGAGGVLFLAALLAVAEEWSSTVRMVLFLTSYAALAVGIIGQMIKDFRKLHFFDENFLMLLATVGGNDHREIYGRSRRNFIFSDWKADRSCFTEQNEEINCKIYGYSSGIRHS